MLDSAAMTDDLQDDGQTLYVVLCNFPDADTAASAARQLVTERLCACVNILPGVRSVYRWEGQIEDAAEVTCLLKTPAGRFEALRARLQALHPYQVPEIVALPAARVHLPYLQWVQQEAAQPPG